VQTKEAAAVGERREFEMTQAQHDLVMEASKSVPAIMFGGMLPATSQERANRAWATLGLELGFSPMTVRPVPGKDRSWYFTAEVLDPAEREDAVREELASALVERGVKVGYYGYIEVEVRLMRQGHGEDSSGEPGSGFAVEASRTVRIEAYNAKYIGRPAPVEFAIEAAACDEELDRVAKAIREVLDDDGMAELQERWRTATENLDADKMKAALAVLES
jgi:hypothetical protein